MEYYNRGRQLLLDLIEKGPKAIFDRLFGKDTKIIFLGIDHAGKTTLLLKLKTDTIHTVAPTSSVREETVQIGHMKVTINDLGGHDTARMGWGRYCLQSDGIIFMIDITDIERYHIVAEAYANLVYTMENSEKKFLPIAVLFNKTDIWKQAWEKRYPNTAVPVLDEIYMIELCSKLGIVPGEGENGKRVSVNYCSVVRDSVSTPNLGFMLGFKWLDMTIRNQ